MSVEDCPDQSVDFEGIDYKAFVTRSLSMRQPNGVPIYLE